MTSVLELPTFKPGVLLKDEFLQLTEQLVEFAEGTDLSVAADFRQASEGWEPVSIHGTKERVPYAVFGALLLPFVEAQTVTKNTAKLHLQHSQVESGNAQVIYSWHSGDTPRALVSSIPTDVLVGTLVIPEKYNHYERRASLAGKIARELYEVDSKLPDGLFVANPSAAEQITLGSGHVHRSPTNNEDETKPRTLLRITQR